MTLSAEDHNDLMQHFLGLVRQYDPVGFEQLMGSVRRGGHPTTPRDTLLDAVAIYRELGSYRTVGTHAQILDRLNEHVRTEGGDRVQSIQVSLTPEEQRLLQRETLDLTPMTDFSGFVRALEELYELISAEGSDSDDQSGTSR